ncbi:MAG: SCO family protein [Candidatus Accumulibacter phosphatis]|uniref:SCO family protein n=1 Tax=Candidatus Accumulibacter phosphatis TaxID=327160 RepID=UPI001A4EB4AC|nr:SCO family protein [Candidatus Accumulibacter phosphatis]
MPLTRLLVALLSTLLTVLALASELDPEQEHALPPPGITGRYLLMDTNGRAVSNEDFPGRFQLISFGYTFCPDICPTTLAEMSLVMSSLGNDAGRLQPVFITVDPERDTASVLRTYVTFFHPRMIGLRGSPALIRRAADSFRVRYEKVREPGAPPDEYAVDHSAGMFLLGPDGSYIRKFAYAVPPAEIGERIREIMAAGDQRATNFHRRTTP